MTRPFYTAPSPQAVRDEAKRIAESQAAWSDEIVELIRNLNEFSGRSALEIRLSRVSRAQVQHALALEYGASDWQDLLHLCETMEHDDFTQIRNRAQFLVEDHSKRHPVAAVRLRKALPELAGKSDREVFDAAITLADAQGTIAKEYGFGSWRALREFVRSHPATDGFLNTPDAVPPDVAAMVDAVDAGDAERLKPLIEANPSLVHARVASDITCGDTVLHRADPRATNGARMTKGHLTVAQLLIDNGIDINAMGGCGDSCFTPPIDASSWIGNQRMAALLLENGADPNCAYWTMGKPVRTAANHKGKAIFRMLLKAGADYTLYETVALGFLKLTRELLDQDAAVVNALDDGALPIVQAAQDVKMTRLLLRYGADPNGQDSRGVTALMEASQAGAKDVVEALLGGGAGPDIFFAIASRDREAVDRMLAADPDCHKSEAVTPVILAAASGEAAIVESLLKAGADPNEAQHRWMQDSPLVTAVSHRHEHLVPLLLEYGADVNPPKAFKWNIPLTAAVRWGNYAGVEMLLAAGAHPSIVSDSGGIGNPLGWTAYVGDLRCAKMLVDAGADRAARNHALIGAAHHGRLSIIELLGTLDTDLHHAHPGGNAMHRARANKHPEALKLLVELDKIHQLPKGRRDDILRPRAEFLNALMSDDGEALDTLIARHPALVDRDLVRNELFHHATGNLQGKPDLRPLLAAVDVLMKHGVPWTIHSAVACDRIEEIDRLANRPETLRQGLHTAAKFNNVQAMKFLLDAGADIDAKEGGWGTALHEAARYRALEAAECLIERGAKVNATDQYANTPRAFCRPGTERSDALCDLLDAHGATA
ncbi:MAG: ankyrin repeat domain-containing protein [Gammaproteobacteria bacterium]|nr:ankyrin repeat domain-containing protein [Gammaproteobacteria bacterium]